MSNNKITIGITQGDINGIGYEVILKALSDNRILDLFIPVIYGSSKVAAFHRKNLDLPAFNLNAVNSVKEITSKRVNIINCTDEEIKVELGQSTEEAGKAAYESLERATDDLNNGLIQAVVTAPINKNNIQSENFHFPGHTEYLEKKFGEKESSLMMLVSEVVKVAVVTGHIPVKNISETITPELILHKLKILNHSLIEDFGIVRPRIAVLGLNPHAGDEGVIGNEEKNIIIPAIKKANEEENLLCFGPYPADGFFGSGNYQKFDAILAMYHDQGLIPFKLLAMEDGVNFTAGLRVIRTSPAHGTAYDLAGQNLASESSFLNALYLACDIYRNRENYKEMYANPLVISQNDNKRGNRIE